MILPFLKFNFSSTIIHTKKEQFNVQKMVGREYNYPDYKIIELSSFDVYTHICMYTMIKIITMDV